MILQRPIRSSPGAIRGTFAVGLLVSLAIAFLASAVFAAETTPSESQVKAAFLLNFTKFIEWPATAFADASSPLTICMIDDPFGSIIDQLVEGETAGGRRVAVQRLRRAPAPKSCQVLFVGRTVKDVPEMLSQLGPGVVTVSDRENFLREGGMIGFVIDGHHVRFDINQGVAIRNSLTINARLLNVARSVQK